MTKPNFGTFRGWDIKWNRWVPGGYASNYGHRGVEIAYWIIQVNDYPLDTQNVGKFRIDPQSLSMFTGLYDKHDDPIFGSIPLPDGSMSKGGDIIDHRYHGHPVNHEVIKYIDSHFVLGKSTYPLEFTHHGDSTFLIIGNKYENPELLEENNDK